MTARAKRTAAARRRWRDQAARLVSTADTRPDFRPERFDVPAVRAHCETILALGRRHRDPDALAVLADWREDTGGRLPVTAFPGRPRGGHDLAFIRPAQRLLDTLDGRCPWAPSARLQVDGCVKCLSNGYVLGRPDDYGVWVPDHTHTPCPACHGTGSNLSGHLPPVEDSPASIDWAHRGHSTGPTIEAGDTALAAAAANLRLAADVLVRRGRRVAVSPGYTTPHRQHSVSRKPRRP